MAETNGHTTIPQGGWRFILNQLSRLGLSQSLGWTFGGDRKIHEVLGYKSQVTYADFKAAYCRQDLAFRLINAYPDDTWGMEPQVREDDQEDQETPFEAAWHALTQRLPVYHML